MASLSRALIESAAAAASRSLLPATPASSAPEIARAAAISSPLCSMFPPLRSSSARSYFPRSFSSRGAAVPPACCLQDPLQGSKPTKELGLLVEVEGVVADIYRFGNRQAFNVAFQKLGLDCAHWTEPIYLDLIRKAGGDEERMLVLFFNRIGWPTSLPTNEKETFMKSVLREKRDALDEFVQSGNLPLRPGVEDFIDDALNEGIPVIMLTAYSKNGVKMSRFLTGKLGSNRTEKIKIIGKEEVEKSLYSQLVRGKGLSSSLEEQLAKETQKAVSTERQRIAQEVASVLKLSVDIDTSPSESIDQIVATLRAGAEYAGLPVQECILVAGGQSGVLGAERIGMPCVVIRSSLTSRAEFRSANAVMDGFGGADLTVSKLRQKRWS